ncbi:MAG: cyclic-phosphate processing receiver domain-containing protein [Candidatus Odinarchaeia archaeon]
MKLYLDDLRKAPKGWIPVRNYRDAIQLLKEFEIEIISLDHDLGELEPSGAAVVNWIEEQVFKYDFEPPKMVVHSMNPVGRDSMLATIASIERMVKNKAAG